VTVFVVLDPVHETIKVWQRTDNRFNLLGVFASGDTFASRPLGEDVEVRSFLS